MCKPKKLERIPLIGMSTEPDRIGTYSTVVNAE